MKRRTLSMIAIVLVVATAVLVTTSFATDCCKDNNACCEKNSDCCKQA